MKYSSVFLPALLAVILGITVHASVIPDDVEDDGVAVVAAKGKDGGDDGSGSGIPTVADNKNPVCRPWYAIRDAIMGDIYHGKSICSSPTHTKKALAVSIISLICD